MSYPRLIGTFVLLAALLPRPCPACGLSPPIGPTGLPAVCHGEDGVRVRAGLTAGGTSTKIDFATDRAQLLQAATAATVDVLPLDRFTLSAALGSSLFGHLNYADRRYDLLPGPIGGLAASYRLLGGALPFIHVSAAYSLARSTARAPDGQRLRSRPVTIGSDSQSGRPWASSPRRSS